MKFDNIIELLDNLDIEYSTGGKNVASGWIGLTCPFCDDNSNHLGIRLNNNNVHCWKCGHHSLYRTLQELTDLSNQEIVKITKFLGVVDKEEIPPLYSLQDQEEARTKNKISGKMSLPRESSFHFSNAHLDYLKSRGLPPLKTIRKYKLRAVNHLGKYKFRIIIPIYMDRKIVNFTARDITGLQEPPYLRPNYNEVSIKKDMCVFNLDTLNEGSDCILCEGPFDVMKMGDGSVSFLGVQETTHQIIELKNKFIRNLYIIYDNDRAGIRNANRVAKLFAPLFKKVEVVRLKGVKDPGQLSLEEAEAIKLKLRFNL